MGGQPHAPADLPTKQEIVWGPQRVWALRGREKSVPPAEIRTRERPARTLVTNYYYPRLPSGWYTRQILAPFFENFSNGENSYVFFRQHGSTVHTAQKSTVTLHNIFGDQIINLLCTARSPFPAASDGCGNISKPTCI